jgi:demethylmenaquinone methyltransferase/2-methoxy-6-polyprenyl-1,4-benzoquinol methylase
MGPEGRTEGWEQRVLPDGSRHEIYRRYFTAESLAAEIDGRVLFAGSWVAMAAVGR